MMKRRSSKVKTRSWGRRRTSWRRNPALRKGLLLEKAIAVMSLEDRKLLHTGENNFWVSFVAF